jgi:hypothetical protein
VTFLAAHLFLVVHPVGKEHIIRKPRHARPEELSPGRERFQPFFNLLLSPVAELANFQGRHPRFVRFGEIGVAVFATHLGLKMKGVAELGRPLAVKGKFLA